MSAGQTVLTPNAELATALIDAIERFHRQAGHELWPTARVRDFDGWLRDQYFRRQFRDAGSARCLNELEERELWRSVVTQSAVGADLLDIEGAARSARRARRAIYEYGIPLAAIAGHGTDESHTLLEWNTQFDARCRMLGYLSTDQLLGILNGVPEVIAWIDSPNWRPVARRWLQKNARLMLAPRSLGAATSCHSLHAESPDEELAAVAAWARANLLAQENFRAWVCVPDLSLRRTDLIDAFDAALAPQRFSLSNEEGAAPYAVAGGTPLAQYAPVRVALETLAASSGAISFERFSALLRAPELQASADEASAAALLDLQLRGRAPSEATMDAWLGLSERIARLQLSRSVQAIARLNAVMQALDNARDSQPFSRWICVWINALEAGPWSLRHRWSSTEYQSAQRLRELLATLASADQLFGTHSRQSAQRILAVAARNTAFQPQTGIPSIWISGQVGDPWLNYDGLWVTACNAQRWPAPVDPIPLLPVTLQREFGVIAAGAASQLAFAIDLQNRWQVRATISVFSYADPLDGSGATSSALLPPELALPWSHRARPRPHWHLAQARAPVLERFTDEWAPPFANGEHTHGVATLRAQSRCPFRGFAETRLKAQPLDKPTPGFNDRERGELLHGALEHVWSTLLSWSALNALSAQAQTQLIQVSVALAISKQCLKRDPGAPWRQREQLRMQGVLSKWLEVERLRQPFYVETLEQGSLAAIYGGLAFKVRLDRVDRLIDGERVLIDYKSGMANADWRGERPDNPQLPVYALLRPEALVAVAYGRVNAGDCGFIAETERGGVFKPNGRITRLEGLPNLAALITVWAQRIEKLGQELAAGYAAVAPTLQACKSCHLQGLCRIPSALDDLDRTDE